MKILLTGASGFVGSAILRELLQEGHEVRALVRAESDLGNLAGLEVEKVLGDLTAPQTLAGALQGCEALFHTAASYRLWVPRPQQMYATNVEGTRNLLQAAARAGVSRIVYTSSVATLGITPDGTPADETTPVGLEDMVGHYKRSKFLAEEEVRRMAREQDLPVVIVNPATVVGPRDRRLTPTGRMILQAASGRMPAYVDTGLNVIHVDDVAHGHLLAFRHGRIGERYILGGENLTLQQILFLLAEMTNHRPPRLRLHPGVVLPVAYLAEGWARLRNGDEPLVTVDGVKLARKRMFFSADKARQELGLTPRPAREALKDAVEWFRRNGLLK